ncbi:MAG: Asp23/Gls24 family envelope stress response protein [Clostridiales bacterium]|nr:Asp23/Gls24 family envelope stress response protein [Clostridiales bacterium]
MEENAEKVLEGSKAGFIKIANDVVATIVGLATTEVNGIAGMSGGIAGGIAELLGRKNLTKGVKVDISDKEVSIDVHVIMEFGVTIPQVAHNVQQNVKNTVESMTGLKVPYINVHVQGVMFPQGAPPALKSE